MFGSPFGQNTGTFRKVALTSGYARESTDRFWFRTNEQSVGLSSTLFLVPDLI